MLSFVKSATAVLCLAATSVAWAGTWGQENWGQMYWGTNPTSAPTQAPTIQSIVADGEDLIVTVADYTPGDDGWSTIQTLSVTCGSQTVVANGSPVRITGLEADTEFDCAVTASNAFGDSTASVQVAMTESSSQGLNIVIIRAALCDSNNPPANC